MCNKTVQGGALLEKKEKCAAPLQYTSYVLYTSFMAAKVQQKLENGNFFAYKLHFS